ncbi:MAG: hypothetical protein ACRDJ4_12225 [Actinomycetota bacterium]
MGVIALLFVLALGALLVAGMKGILVLVAAEVLLATVSLLLAAIVPRVRRRKARRDRVVPTDGTSEQAV